MFVQKSAAALAAVFSLFLLVPSVAAGASDFPTPNEAVWDYGAIVGGADRASSPANGTGSPHAGYGTVSANCMVCHGNDPGGDAYGVLRPEAAGVSCEYCHVGSSHASAAVYDLNPDGTGTRNGHTIGASPEIPGSSALQQTREVEIRTSGARGEVQVERVAVREFAAERRSMYRLIRDRDATGSGSAAAWAKVGPVELTCITCHEPHGDPELLWRPAVFGGASPEQSASAAAGYRLLRRYPSGTTTGQPDAAGRYAGHQLVKVIEETATPGLNVSGSRSMDGTYTENGATAARPLWVSRGFRARSARRSESAADDPAQVTAMSLSYWCADCHDLEIGGAGPAKSRELGRGAHGARTHSVPFSGAGQGAGQCYSCHRDDLAVAMGEADPEGYGQGVKHGSGDPGGAAADSCSRCHYGSRDYWAERVSPPSGGSVFRSDFPHSGKDTDIKLLGSYSVEATGGGESFRFAAITEDDLDAVCIRCHPGVGTHQ